MDIIDSFRKLGIAKIIIPQAVKEEFAMSGAWIDTWNIDEAIDPNNIDINLIDIPPSLGDGERQAIAIACMISKTDSKNTPLVITDDLRARKICKKMGIKVIGTLGLIEFAKKYGIITKNEALNLLDRIPNTSLYITKEVLKEAQYRIMLQ